MFYVGGVAGVVVGALEGLDPDSNHAIANDGFLIFVGERSEHLTP
jgi:hypothetical protein